MKRFLLFTNFFLFVVFYYKQKKIKEAYNISMVDIESEEDILEKMGMYKDKEGKIHTIEELYE
ncbi:hypothetical protein [Staphylococcus equorum]|uniref:hypothetical protein n=1 Tax=Staphylococcus equorum TaxID=246432 RepID=UPI000852A39A|nr:hypothetical protein [Staphylococcus equorum]OEK59200.1 hypothetical protein ASS99_13810 [Staphylococcus equorum]